MRLRMICSLFIVIMLLMMTCSCEKGENNMKAETSASDKSLIELVSQVYDDTQLMEIANFNGSLNELKTKYPIDCLREDNGVYRASYQGNESIAVLLFDKLGNKITGKVCSTLLSKSDFDKIVKGQSLSDVQLLDPNGEYLFLYTGRDDIPRMSSHYTKDGYLITIEYDASNAIINIYEELI